MVNVGGRMHRFGLLLSMAAVIGPAAPAAAQAPEASARVHNLVAKMTLEEKLTLTQGGKDPSYRGQIGYVGGVPRLNIPEIRMTDGPVGVLNGYDMTALPQTIGLAATFDRDVAYRFGNVLGTDARSMRMDSVLAPEVDIARTADWGRNITTLGEDPYLSAQLGVPVTKAIQDAGVMAVIKHYTAYAQVFGVGGGLNAEPGMNFVVDDRTLHEIYLPAFEATLKGGASGVMASYNKINGDWSAQQPKTLSLLRDEFKWNGFVVSDWHGNHSTSSIAAGLDMEMPANGPVVAVGKEAPFWGATLKAAIQSGQVPPQALDRAVTHILTQMDRIGMLDGRRIPPPAKLDIMVGAKVGYEVATEAAVLLRNQGALPLSQQSLGSLGLIGPTARQLAVGPGTARSEGVPSRIRSPLESLKAAAPDAKIAFAIGDDLEGVAIPVSALISDDGKPGLTRSSRDGVGPTVDAMVDFTGENALERGRSYTWSGTIRPSETGEYMIMSQSWGGAANLYVDDELKTGSARLAFGIGTPKRWSSLVPTTDNLDNGQAILRLEAGKSYKVRLVVEGEPYERVQVRLAWVTPAMRQKNIADAVDLAKRVDTPIVFAWARGGESFDPEMNLSLPRGQDALIAAVAEVNPNTIVVLNTGNPVSMPWRNKVKAILEMWYPGQEGGPATADLLLGKVNPSGHLPITFPSKATDTPALAPGHPERFHGVDGRIVFSEGIFVGYRWYDQNNIEPIYPFGYGLSYTSFTYSNLRVRRSRGGIDVGFDVRNSGAREGADVPQLYVGAPDRPPVPMAPKVLAGFERVTLQPGQTKHVSLHIDPRQLSYWSTERKGWLVAGGRRPVMIGASSRDIRLRGSVDVASANR